MTYLVARCVICVVNPREPRSVKCRDCGPGRIAPPPPPPRPTPAQRAAAELGDDQTHKKEMHHE